MFLTSSNRPINEKLKSLCDEIEQQVPSKTVLSAHSFRYKVYEVPLEVSVSESRRLNVLEEFILRAGTEIEPAPTQHELADILGLDHIFINSTVNDLTALDILEANSSQTIRLTALGHELFKAKSIPQQPKKYDLFMQFDPLTGDPVFSSSSTTELISDQLPNLADYVKLPNSPLQLSSLTLPELINLLIKSRVNLHSPENGKLITAFKIDDSKNLCWKEISLFIIFDALENKIQIEARQKKRILIEASNNLNMMLEKDLISLNALCKLTDEELERQCQAAFKNKNAEVETRIESIRQRAKQEQSQITQLRGSAISQELDRVIENINYQLLIYSPWISRKVIDNHFVKRLKRLAAKGVWILIGYGIAAKEDEEERKVDPQVLHDLSLIHSPSGIEAVQIHWLGRSHAKELIADQKIHILGSNNLLSFRANSGLWDESVYKVSEQSQVQLAYEFYANRFNNKASELFKKAHQTHDIKMAKSALCIWGAIGKEEYSFNIINKCDWKELYPVWIKVTQQGILSKRTSADSACVKILNSLGFVA